MTIEKDSFSYALCDDDHEKEVSVCSLYKDSFFPKQKSHQACEDITIQSSENPRHDQWGHLVRIDEKVIIPKILHGNNGTSLIAKIVNMKDCNTRELSFVLGTTMYYEIFPSEGSIIIFYDGGIDGQFRLLKETFDTLGNPSGKPFLYLHDTDRYLVLRPIFSTNSGDGYYVLPSSLKPTEIQVRNLFGRIKETFELASDVNFYFFRDGNATFFMKTNNKRVMHIMRFGEILKEPNNIIYITEPTRTVLTMLSVESDDIFLVIRESSSEDADKSTYFLERVSQNGSYIESTSIAENSAKRFYDSEKIYQIDIDGKVCIRILFLHGDRVWAMNTSCFTHDTLFNL
ncbi:hypothetical protein QAD02_010326 [Eretmocerus hayati]|uniref:Uncharacterized protein n=1 Tax=Eretmocerus hayati TaxID=131215 RepID=A0ACC2NC49_9HYME|nr:hypothetical protein QAD02_010326 [Eretmocerus hayati]